MQLPLVYEKIMLLFKSLPEEACSFVLGILKKQKGLLLLSLLIGIVVRSAAFIPIIAFQIYLDELLPSLSGSNLILFIVIFVSLSVIENALKYIQGLLLAGVLTRSSVLMIDKLESELENRSVNHLSEIGKAAIVHRFNELEASLSNFISAFFSLAIDIPILLIATVISLFISPAVTAIFYIQLMLVIGYNLIYQKKIKSVISEQIDVKGQVDGVLLSKIESKLSGAEIYNDDARKQWKQGLLSISDNSIKASSLQNTLATLESVTRRGGYIAFLSVSFFLFASNSITVGQIVALGMLSSNIMGAGTNLTNNISVYQSLNVLLAKLQYLIQEHQPRLTARSELS